MWTRRCRRKRLPFPPTRGCITKRGVCWCAKPSASASSCGRVTGAWVSARYKSRGRYAHAQQLKRARKETRKLRTYLGRVLRDIQRKAATSGIEVDPQLSQYLERAGRIGSSGQTSTSFTACRRRKWNASRKGKSTRSTSSVARCR